MSELPAVEEGSPIGTLTPTPPRTSRILPEIAFGVEANGERWSAYDSMGVEMETAELLYGLVRALKPQFTLEVGAWPGVATAALCKAVNDNHYGRYIGIEREVHLNASLAARFPLGEFRLELEPAYVQEAGFAFFDSAAAHRKDDFAMWLEQGPKGSIACYHDVLIGQHPDAPLSAVLIRTPRGLSIYQHP